MNRSDVQVLESGLVFETPYGTSPEFKLVQMGEKRFLNCRMAREIGACYAGIYMVVNYAEGIIKDWEHKDLSDIFYQESHTVGHILLNALAEADTEQTSCNCLSLRKATLLKEINKEQN